MTMSTPRPLMYCGAEMLRFGVSQSSGVEGLSQIIPQYLWK